MTPDAPWTYIGPTITILALLAGAWGWMGRKS